jgi:hypothetical protein
MGRTPRSNANLRIPTVAEFQAFDGAHCKGIYNSLPAGWRCPGCGRSTYEILRWTLRFPKSPNPFEGWAGGYHKHHDHATDRYRYGLSPDYVAARFEACVLCEQCNSADGAAKRRLALPAAFSFSPDEIRQFVAATPHGFHHVDYDVARAIFQALYPGTPQT